MRYDVPIYFQKVSAGEYDSSTGDYGDETCEETLKYANVTDAGRDTLLLVYGSIRQGCVVIRLRRRYAESFDSIRIRSKVYKVDQSKVFRRVHTLIASEVQ